MPLPERLSYLYNAADFAEMARKHSGARPEDFNAWWHAPVPREVITSIMTAYALGHEYGVFEMTDPEWQRYDVQVVGVDSVRIMLQERFSEPPVPEPYVISEQAPPKAIHHGDIRINFERVNVL